MVRALVAAIAAALLATGCSSLSSQSAVSLTPNGDASAQRGTPTKSVKGYAVLYTFPSTGSSPHTPEGGVIFDTADDIFGTTISGGASDCGAVFELTSSGTTYAENTAYSFNETRDGCFPMDAPIADKKGDLYATSTLGGEYQKGSIVGTAVELAPSGGTYQTKYLYSFGANRSGHTPFASFVEMDGTLYTTAYSGGEYAAGSIVGLTANGLQGGDVYAFRGPPDDGGSPHAGLTGSGGSLYTATYAGGKHNEGAVIAYYPGTGEDSLLYSFGRAPHDGTNPYGGVILDKSGNIYGTTQFGGGSHDEGIVYELIYSGSGYTEKILHVFTGKPDGAAPFAGLVLKGTTLYGTTELGGSKDDGTIFQISTSGSKYKVDYDFDCASDSGCYPHAGLLVKGSALYGTAADDGDDGGGAGTVFRFVP